MQTFFLESDQKMQFHKKTRTVALLYLLTTEFQWNKPFCADLSLSKKTPSNNGKMNNASISSQFLCIVIYRLHNYFNFFFVDCDNNEEFNAI